MFYYFTHDSGKHKIVYRQPLGRRDLCPGTKKTAMPKKKVIVARNLKECSPSLPLKTRTAKKRKSIFYRDTFVLPWIIQNVCVGGPQTSRVGDLKHTFHKPGNKLKTKRTKTKKPSRAQKRGFGEDIRVHIHMYTYTYTYIYIYIYIYIVARLEHIHAGLHCRR